MATKSRSRSHAKAAPARAPKARASVRRPSLYDPAEHIQQLAVAPRDIGVLDQREITVQSYRSTVPFDLERLEGGLKDAWLSPKIRFGLFSRLPISKGNAATVVLGLQDELSVRAYDYDERRPLWFSWQNVIVETVSIHYFCDDDGLLRFTTTGGGRRITDDRLHEFNATFLDIPKDAVTRQQFDLEKLRSLCFTRFIDRLYMLRFKDPSGEEYRSIDHALFQSREYIDPDAERLKEIRKDPKVTIESFDSDVEVYSAALAAKLPVRFFLRGVSGSLRLRFPKIRYKKEPHTVEEQASVFYRLVQNAVHAVLDDDYYAHQPRKLDEIEVELGLHIDMIDLSQHREVLANPEPRADFFHSADFGDAWQYWQPHLRALAELAEADGVASHCSKIIHDLAPEAPTRAIDALRACREDAKLQRLGGILAAACCEVLQRVPAEHRAAVESELVEWALTQPDDAWRVDVDTETIEVDRLPLRLGDLSLDTIVAVLGRLLTALHAKLMTSGADVQSLLGQMRWCIEAAKALPPNHYRLPPSLRLIAGGSVPRRLTESNHVLREPATSFADLDGSLLEQFGLPAWPSLRASISDNGVVVSNEGIGAAPCLSLRPTGALFDEEDAGCGDLPAGEQITLALPGQHREAEIRFRKYRTEHLLICRLDDGRASTPLLATPSPAVPIHRKRLEAQRQYRKQIDGEGLVIGSSPEILRMFEEIHHANLLNASAAVLILGEPGVGKTHIARLIHGSSERSTAGFLDVNAGGAGGDLNIQRGEWVGYGSGHGIAGIDRKGRPGHLMRAHGGTLFVDEFAALSLDLQVIFLSVLEQRPVERIGGDPFTPDVRCIFATNADIDAAVSHGSLRRDLVDRIGCTIHIPPLRDRRGDILLLARHFAGSTGIEQRCLVALLRHDWPGNIRELRLTLDRAVARAQGEGAAKLSVEHCDLPPPVVHEVEGLADRECRRELWLLADSIARAESCQLGAGLQQRAAEILDVTKSQASKMYRAFDLNGAA